MRHFTLAFVMAVALLLAGGASALPSSGINPDNICAATAPDHVPFVASNVNGVAMPGANANYCLHYAELRGLLDSTLVGSLCADPAYASLCALLVPCISDINGEVIIDERDSTPSGGTEIYVTGNGIYDASNELAVLRRILTTPSFDNGVITYAQVLAAYEHNFYQVQCDLKVQNIAGFSTLYPAPISGVIEIIAAHITIGDGTLVIDTSDPTGNVTTATGSWGVASGIVFLLCGLFADPPFSNPCTNANIIRGDYDVSLEAFLSADGDADGDGATNVEEALWYTQASCGTVTPPNFPPNPGPFVTGPSFVCPPVTGTTYIDAALSPSLTPLPADQSFFIVSNPPYVETGQDVSLMVTTAIPGLDLTSPSVTYQWKLGLVDVVDGPGVTGATTRTLTFTGATSADDGTYFCLVDYSTVNPAVLTKPFILTVLPLGSVPVGGGLAMGLLAGACALAGAMGIRRKS